MDLQINIIKPTWHEYLVSISDKLSETAEVCSWGKNLRFSYTAVGG